MNTIQTVETVLSCNLCDSPNATPIYSLTDTLYNIPGEFTLQQCTNCGLMYLSPRPTLDSIGAYYPADYSCYRPPIENEKWAIMRWIRKRKLAKRRQLIEQFSKKTEGEILDVGCATGLFLQEMIQSGWHGKGIEPIASAAEYALETFGLQVFQGNLNQSTYASNSFDVITFWDVLEHTFSPSQELADAARLLHEGGLIAISVPNWDSVERRLFGNYWQGLDSPRHLYVFTRNTLTDLLNEADFTILDWVCFMPSYFSFIISLERWLQARAPRLSKIARRVLTIPGMRLPFEPFFALINHLGKGSVITVFAVKQSHQSGESSS